MSENKLWNIQLRVPAEPEFLGVVRLACAGISHRLGFEHEVADDFKLAATEACSHLLSHGSQDLEVLWEIENQRVTLQVRATGDLDPDEPDLSGGQSSADQEWKEIGLLLMKSVMDQVEELHLPPGLRLVKKIEVSDD